MIEVPEEFIEISGVTKELKDITFSKYKNIYDEALDEIIKALEQINRVELVKLPVENLEGIIRLLITVCCECNNKIKKNNSFVAQIDRDLSKIIDIHVKLEALDKLRKKLEKDLTKLRGDYARQSENCIRMQENMNYQLEATMKKNKRMKNYKEK